MRRSPSALVLLVPLLACPFSGCERPPDRSTWNVLVVTLDTTRADRIGAFGGTAVPTPRLDAMAEQGIRFTQALSTNPLTLPAHASMFTGRYPFRHGVRHNGAYRLSGSETTLAERLRGHGFRTGAFVGAFVLDPQFGLDQGFETYSSVSSSSPGADFLRPSSVQRTADAVNAAFFAWLDSIGSSRSFAWVHYYDPHRPYAPPERPGLALHGNGYDREISFVDHCFGELIDGLERRGLLDRTVLLVLGDHGESLGSHGEATHGIFLYEPALRVPFFVRAPGLLRGARAYGSVVSVADVAPTVLALLGLPPLPETDGRPLFEKGGRLVDEDGGRTVYAETWMPRLEWGWSDLAMLRDGRHKLIRAPRPEWYDLAEDPEEGVNLADSRPDAAGEMDTELTALLASQGDSGTGEIPLSPDELARLQSLGYLRGGLDTAGAAEARSRPDPKDHVAEAVLLERAEDALSEGDLERAREGFEDVLGENPGNHAALLGRARTLLRLGRIEEAHEGGLAALAAAASDPLAPGPVADNARGMLATLASLLGRQADAEAFLARTSDASSEPGRRRSRLGVLLAGAKNREDAGAIVRAALERRPSDPWSWAAAVEVRRRSGDTEGARDAAARLVSLGPASVQALIDVGVSAQRAGEVPLARALFESALRLDSDHPDVLGYVGTARLAAGDLDGAERVFARVDRLRPQDPRTAMYRGNIALLRGDEPSARTFYEEALRRDPRFVLPLLHYAGWLAERGRTGEAIAAARDALARRPDDPAAAALLDRLHGVAGTR